MGHCVLQEKFSQSLSQTCRKTTFDPVACKNVSAGAGIQGPTLQISCHPCESADPWNPKADLVPRKTLHRPRVLLVHTTEIKHMKAGVQSKCAHSMALPLSSNLRFLFTYCQKQHPGLRFLSTALIHHHHITWHMSPPE